ncbi:MAG TPA: glycosyltransferase family 2 protein [Solirubrobacteraceae bacterium]|jgi:N-acetylglucosaminyl-diphospho-decaprenol L-rhamnosyltransferase|nr:glycosyltransferase family 2 protein [Solirubrobacteraceae bacterium]
MQGEVTAVVVTHNSARHLQTLGRALADGSLAPAHMLAVDNLSSDGTVEQARTAGFDVVETGSNDGFGAGCNAGLSATTTELVLFCNPDVRPARAALEQLVAALASAPDAAIAGAVLDGQLRPRRFSRISTNVAGFLPSSLLDPLRRLTRRSAGADSQPDHPGAEPEPGAPTDERAREQATTAERTPAALTVDYAEGAFILCRAAALRSVGGFDERFFLYFEEEDLSRRLRERGWTTLLVPAAEVSHEQRGSSEGFGNAAMAPFFTHSLYWYYRKHSSRGYAELARCTVAVCVLLDQAYRALARRPQMYGPRAAIAPFRSAAAVRCGQQRRTGRAS